MKTNKESQELVIRRTITLKRNQAWELLILASLIVLLLLYIMLRSAAGFSYKLPSFSPIDETDIQSIRWNHKGSSELSLVKDGAEWYIGAAKYPAKQSYVDTLLQQLSRPDLQDLVSKSGNLLTFGLNSEQAFKLEAFGDSRSLRLFYVGKSSSSGRYSFVRLSEDDSRVFTLSENLTAILEKSIDDLRDRLVVSFASGEIEKLQIRELELEDQEDTKTVFVEKKDGKWQIPGDVTWNEEEIERLVNRFAGMNAQNFIPEFPKNLEKKVYELKFIAKGGVNYTIEIATKPLDKDQGYAAKSSSYGFPFTLNNYTVESMLKDFGFVKEDQES